MEKYSEFRPTCFDSAGAFLDDRQDWLVCPVSRTRDSGPFNESNFEAALKILGGESEEVEVHRFGHWGPGWFEIIIVAPGSEAAKKAEEIEASLENYPVLDDEDLSRREYDGFLESWGCWGAKDFRKFLVSTFALSERAEEVLDDMDDDKLCEFYMEHASEPYYSESSGVSMEFREQDFCSASVVGLLRSSREVVES